MKKKKMNMHDMDVRAVSGEIHDLQGKVDCSGQCIKIFREGKDVPILIQNAENNKRPYIHPIVVPDGKGILTENQPSHHLWQHGLYIGLNDVNGIGFWKEGLSEKGKLTDGTFHPKRLASPKVNKNIVNWTVETDYRAPDGKHIMTELQEWILKDMQSHYEMQLTWKLTANIDLRFGKYSYGGLFLRMPYRKELGAQILNSEGKNTQIATEAQRARWVAISMPIEGRTDKAGIAILDHKDDPDHPVCWRTDGTFGISPSRCIAGEWRLSKTETTVSKYGIYVFCGNINPLAIEDQWQSFCQTESEVTYG